MTPDMAEQLGEAVAQLQDALDECSRIDRRVSILDDDPRHYVDLYEDQPHKLDLHQYVPAESDDLERARHNEVVLIRARLRHVVGIGHAALEATGPEAAA